MSVESEKEKDGGFSIKVVSESGIFHGCRTEKSEAIFTD